MTPHRNPYPLGWVCNNAKLQVMKLCKIIFAITSKLFDEVKLDVVPLDICGIVFGSPYLFDMKSIFYHQENKYHIFKNEIENIVKAHRIKTNVSLVSTRQMKRLVNASKSFVLTVMKQKKEDISNILAVCDPGYILTNVPLFEAEYVTKVVFRPPVDIFLMNSRLVDNLIEAEFFPLGHIFSTNSRPTK
jgi:hypothetical protein